MHLTIRMAWHDNNWNGKVCNNPEENSYCVGSHSLLSGRIEKKRDLRFEKTKPGVDVCKLSKNNVPPCYWSINAFGKKSIKIQHRHAFDYLNDYTIPDVLLPYSVFTWPFKLSFVHNNDNKAKHGNYPPDLESRIDDFVNKFTPGNSVMFFYSNYDNPVSADDMKYLLLGCSLLTEDPQKTSFEIEEEQLIKIRQRSSNMKNFPTINWALQFTHDPASSVLLPYKEYLQYVEQNAEDFEKLEEMKAIIEEPSLISSFKYVAMDINDDKCLYLLYKLRKSIKIIQEHNQVVVKSDFLEEEHRIESLIDNVWKRRGIYPSLARVLNVYLEDPKISANLANALSKAATPEKDVLQIIKNLIKQNDVPKSLIKHKDIILDLVDNRKFIKYIDSIIKLSLFNLTDRQIFTILDNPDLLSSINRNPYILFEEYQAEENDLDQPDLQDEPIDLYKIDIGMIPDRRIVTRHRNIQNLSEDSPQRVRAVIINYLYQIGDDYGHCYDNSNNLLKHLKDQPLIYKNNINIDDSVITGNDSEYSDHFIEKLHIEKTGRDIFLYLKDIWEAENQVRDILINLSTSRKDHNSLNIKLDNYIEESIKILKDRIPDFDINQFKEERKVMYKNVFRKSFYLITGRPGSGKTFELSKIIEILTRGNEDVIVLAPTGKAALRLSQNIKANTNVDLKAETIDRFIYSKGYWWAYSDWNRLNELSNKDKLTVENLILDESSMIDLNKLKILLSIVRIDKQYPKRFIMVGDENQLPPIGFGKPFYDIIMHFISKDNLRISHYVSLQSNCRQENDPNILLLSEAFTNRKRYDEDSVKLIDKTGSISHGLNIVRWYDKQDFLAKWSEALDAMLPKGLDENGKPLNLYKQLNKWLGLYESGYVNNKNYQFKDNLKLDVFQFLSPYRSGHAGTLAINNEIQMRFRASNKSFENRSFYHSDKIIRLSNWYWGYGQKRILRLSNGSIGVVTGEGYKRKYYFPDADRPFDFIDSDENFDLAYAITIHKAQGSDFDIVFLAIPKKLTLLCKELIYTALTRSKQQLFIFLQENDDNLLSLARNRSFLLRRNTSIFLAPEDSKAIYQPEPGVYVKSKIEFIIYKALQKSGLKFSYEQILQLAKRTYKIKPDFTITIGKDNIYWEHLGMLDMKKYYIDWQRRKQDYEEHGLLDNVVTTDDLDGVNDGILSKLIDDIRSRKFADTPQSSFSNHHYRLY